jgi:hypothetical protein
MGFSSSRSNHHAALPEGFLQPYQIEAISGGRERQIAHGSAQFAQTSHAMVIGRSGERRPRTVNSGATALSKTNPAIRV